MILIFRIDLPTDQFPLSAELELNLTDDAKDLLRHVRPIRLFPQQKDIEFFKADVEGRFGIDATMNFSTPQLNLMTPYGGVGGQAKGELGATTKIVFGPFSYSFRKASIKVFGVSDPHIVWQYVMQSELAGKSEFKSVLVLKVAQEVRMVKMDAILKVVPARYSWLIFKSQLPPLPFLATLGVELTHLHREGKQRA